MFIRLPWLVAAFTPITLGFWSLIPMGISALGSLFGRGRDDDDDAVQRADTGGGVPWGKLGVLGAGMFSNWLGGRQVSKQHQAQLASEERRQAMMIAATQAWLQQQAAAQQQYAQQRSQALGALGSHLGMDPALITAAQGMQRQPQMANPYAGFAMQTAGAPTQGGGFNYLPILQNVFGPQPAQVPQAQQGPSDVYRGR